MNINDRVKEEMDKIVELNQKQFEMMVADKDLTTESAWYFDIGRDYFHKSQDLFKDAREYDDMESGIKGMAYRILAKEYLNQSKEGLLNIARNQV